MGSVEGGVDLDVVIVSSSSSSSGSWVLVLYYSDDSGVFCVLGECHRLDLAADIVRIAAVVLGEVHKTVAFGRAVDIGFWCVGREELIVRS